MKECIDIDALAAQLQNEGAKSFVKSWNELRSVIALKNAALNSKGLVERQALPMNVLVVDVGGTHVKVLASGQNQSRHFDSGPALVPRRMVLGVRRLPKVGAMTLCRSAIRDLLFAIERLRNPHNLGSGWAGFNFEAAFGHPVKLINDAAMQALGSYKGGRMLFLGLGTRLGSTLIVDGIIEAMELGHLPYKRHTYEDYALGRTAPVDGIPNTFTIRQKEHGNENSCRTTHGSTAHRARRMEGPRSSFSRSPGCASASPIRG